VPRIASVLERCLARRRVCQVSPEPRWLYDHRSPRFRITLPHVAYVKIADGCSHACSFCMIPKLRGPFRSRRMGSVVEEIRALSADGRLKEVCLIAQDTTAYGRDLYGRPRLTDLLGKILREKRVPWVRLLYAYPRSFNGDLVDLMANEPALCRYVDLPLQHCNDRILKRMRRGTTKKATLQMLERLRDGVPGVTIRTTLMVGFPGETEREFRELFDFVATQRFDRLGLFSFSPQKGTPAAGYPAAVPEEVKQERYHAIMLLQQTISRERNRRRIGETVNVLVDGVDDGNGALLRGRSEADAPEIDGAVLIPGGRAKPGSFIRVRVTGATEYDLIGEEAGPA
jgi:ribosomal protein S12 methylthiotransferase